MAHQFAIYSGTANPELALALARLTGLPFNAPEVERFPDGELSVELLDPVRRKEVVLVQPTCPPVNEHLVELLALADAACRASAAHITAIIPYFGYARSDKRHGRREPITASMVALLLQAVGVDHVVTIDMHAPQLEGFFHIPVDSLTAMPTLCADLESRLPDDTVVVAPDAGAMRLATRYAQRLGTALVVLHKRRESGTETEVTHLVGDVRDRACLIVDDMISTGGTIARSIATLLEAGARHEITVAATHGLLLEGAREKLTHEAVREVVVTDTMPVEVEAWPHLRVVSVAPLLASALQRFMMDGSLSDLI
ncbi:MAG: ribose-phosphate pyrophosphokinase [Chloroflexota bacterium]|nr:ribose-phosphate pyrophosphokinase [Chloroflexota bacterium]